ncbi:MAG: glycosyltransferase N-terminal domain-containing protein [Bacteroidales bacterium]|nr:glycosyltransferase N-terminal domain-containing protein [Bacteroidales bacterium]
MNPLYNIGIHLYGAAINIATLFSPKASKRAKGARNAFHVLEQKRMPKAEYIWFHAASLGEFEQGRPIIEAIKQHFPDYKIALTFFSPSGYEVRCDYKGADLVCYLPLDTPNNARRFVELLKPKKAIFIKYEFWGNILETLHKNNIDTYLVSAIFRNDQPFFKKIYGGMFRKMLKCYTKIFVQNEQSQQLLSTIGVESILSGDTRFDRVCDIAESAKQLPIIEAFAQDAEVVVAGSTWPKDEEILIRYINANKEKKMIIVPHEINDERIQQICNGLRRSFALYTKTTYDEVVHADCLIVDTIGLLSSIYQYGRIAYIGGGFGVGIHNILEAAVWGMPVIFGPNYQKFQEAKDLLTKGDGYTISTFRRFENLTNELFYDKDAGKVAKAYVLSKRGATAVIMKEVFNTTI